MDEIRLTGVLENGYGLAPKLVMTDKELSIESKAIYCYISSFCGNGTNAFPSVETILHHLGIGKNRFYKHVKPLEEKGYITVISRRKGNRRDSNLYKLNMELNLERLHSEDIQDEPLHSEDIQNEDSNNNSINNNNLNNNSINNIYTFWNEQKIMQHKKLTGKIKRKIKTTLKDYKEKEIKESIRNYAEVLNGDEYFFTYRWTLVEFLNRGLEKFMDRKVAMQNYLKRDGGGKNGPSTRNGTKNIKFDKSKFLYNGD